MGDAGLHSDIFLLKLFEALSSQRDKLEVGKWSSVFNLFRYRAGHVCCIFVMDLKTSGNVDD